MRAPQSSDTTFPRTPPRSSAAASISRRTMMRRTCLSCTSPPSWSCSTHTTTSRAIADGRTAAYKTTPRENEMSLALPRPTPQQQQVQVQEQSVAGILAPHQTSSGALRGSLVERQREALRQHCLRMMGGKSWPSGNSARGWLSRSRAPSLRPDGGSSDSCIPFH